MSVLAPTRPAPCLNQFRHHAVLPAHPRAVAGARRLVRAAIRSWGIPVDPDTAALLVSELMTNAVTHDGDGAAPVALTIDGGDDHLRVEVHDASASPPAAGDEAPAAGAEHGRGLLIVGLLAATWGWHPTTAGKAVYFTLTP